MFEFIRQRLSRKILFVLAVSAAVFMSAVIYFVVVHQTDEMTREMLMASDEIEHTLYAGIKYPMTIGDKERVEQELLDIKKASGHLEIFICDTEQNIIYSTQTNAINSKISHYISNKIFLKALDGLLKTGHDPDMAFEDKSGNTRYTLTSYPLLNHQECNHCHGSSKKVLGSMVVRINTEENYAAIAHLRNYNIIISIIGIIALTILMHIILSRLMKQPLGDFAVKINELTSKIPEGDYSTRIDIKRLDEIGTLINSFNHLTETLDQKNNALRKVHIELADSNKELRLAKEKLEDMNDTLEHRVEERTKELQKSEEQLRAFALRLAEAEEHERKRLSQELHDEVGQHLSVLGINLNLILSQATTELPEMVRSRIVDS
ncbi:MAG: histidine kinase, partial [Nitrospira sp.]|nr:histidine kinase [Nitrospira sp.]